MEDIKLISLDFLKQNYKVRNSQKDYIYIPDFRIEALLSEPYRSNYFCIGFIRKGEMILETNLFSHKIKGPALVFADFTPIKRWQQTNKDYKAESFLFSDFFLEEKLLMKNVINIIPDMLSRGAYVAALSDSAMQNIEGMFEIINENSIDVQSFYQKEIVRGIGYSLVYTISDIYHRTGGDLKETKRLDQKFRRAVSDYSKKHHNVKFYADLLHVHPKYLSQIISSETGRTAREWIQRQIILEAKILLQNPNLTFTQIAETLNFPDQSAFGKYFKKYAEVSPSAYRSTQI